MLYTYRPAGALECSLFIRTGRILNDVEVPIPFGDIMAV